MLASRRDDIAQVQTLAGNLSPRQWVALHDLRPLTGSLEPLDERQRLAHVKQRHFVGSEDRVVPPPLLDRYRRTLGEARCVQSIVVPGARHGEGLEQAWRTWRNQPLVCQP